MAGESTAATGARGYALATMLFLLALAALPRVAESAGFQQEPVTGLLSIEVENADTNLAQGGHSWVPSATAGASGSASLVTTPNNNTNVNTGYVTGSPRLDYVVNFTELGTHYVWLRGVGGTSADDSAHVGLNNAAEPNADRITGFTGAWGWASTTMDAGSRARIEVTRLGEQTLNIWMREDGLILDKIVLSKSATFQPTSYGAEGPPQSLRGAPQPALQFSSASLTYTVDEGVTTPQQQVVSLATSDASTASYNLVASEPWLSVNPTSGNTPAGTVTVTANPSGLVAGQYTATITATANTYLSDTINVTLNVQTDLFATVNFNNGDDSAWGTVEATRDLASWQIVNGQFRQLNAATVTNATNDTYITGTYAVLNTYPTLGDFEFSVDITPEATAFPRQGDDVGIMFRYVNDDNYYRLSINSKFGQTRLERRINGDFSTIAVTSQGYLPNQTMRVGLRMQGPVMMLYRDYGGAGSVLDGEPYLAGYDSSLASGSIALYTQSEAAFDNVLIKSLSPAPRVGLVSPVPFGVDTDAAVLAQAVVMNAGGAANVAFELDGSVCGTVSNPQAALYQATCNAAAAGEHTVEAILKDPLEVDRDSAVAVASNGIRAITLGDSITNGTDDQYWGDNIGADIVVGVTPVGPRQVGFRGYQTVLHDQLTADSSYAPSNVYFNEGIPGDASDRLLYDRLPSIIERHFGSNLALITIGTNDANRRNPPDPGVGCANAACNNTFKGNLLALVDILEGANIEPVFAKIPPLFGVDGVIYDDPLAASTRNTEVVLFNAAIDEVTRERSLRAGPDFYAEFLGNGDNRFTLFDDVYHPNSLGYVWMANSWKQVFAPDGTVPFILNGLCVRTTSAACASPSPYKQNIRQVGDTYYTDRSYTLTAIPTALNNGVWISTANNDKTNARSDYLEFSVDRDVDVYIAYSSTVTSRPIWMQTFTDTTLDLGVSAGSPTLRLYSRFYPADATVTLGGSAASGVAGAINNNYIVVVVPR